MKPRPDRTEPFSGRLPDLRPAGEPDIRTAPTGVEAPLPGEGPVAVILGNGDFPRRPYPRHLIRTADRLVCCDGALAAYLRNMKDLVAAGRLPDAVVGDLDSLPRSLRETFRDRIVRIGEQDDNDQTKAFRYVLQQWPDVRQIHILGASGKREDHTVGNLSLLMEYTRLFDLRGKRVDMVSDWSTAFALTDTATLCVGEGRRFSLLTPDNTLRIRSEGLVWPTDAVVFDNWWKATLNRTCADNVTLTFSHPSLALVILD